MKEIRRYIPSKYKIMFKVLFVAGIYKLLNLFYDFSKTQEHWLLSTGFIIILVVLPIILWMNRVYKDEMKKESEMTEKEMF